MNSYFWFLYPSFPCSDFFFFHPSETLFFPSWLGVSPVATDNHLWAFQWGWLWPLIFWLPDGAATTLNCINQVKFPFLKWWKPRSPGRAFGGGVRGWGGELGSQGESLSGEERGAREKRCDSGHQSKVEVTGSADGLDMKCERQKTRVPDLLSWAARRMAC